MMAHRPKSREAERSLGRSGVGKTLRGETDRQGLWVYGTVGGTVKVVHGLAVIMVTE